MPATLEETRHQAIGNSPKRNGLRCYVYKRSDSDYIAECIDLDITVEAETPEAAQESLMDALHGYIETVHEVHDQALLSRPSPLSHRIRFQLFRLQAALTHQGKKFRFFHWLPTENRPLRGLV